MSQWVKVAIVWGGEDPDYTCLLARNESMSYFFIHSWEIIDAFTLGNAVRTEFVWDSTEPIATRPLAMRAKNWGLNLFYTHDGNKNVSEVFYRRRLPYFPRHPRHQPRRPLRKPLPILLGIPRCSFGTYLLQLSSLSFFLWALDTAR